MQYPILLWITVAILEVIRHWYLITKKKRSPNKVISFLARAVVALTIFFLWEWRPAYTSLPAYIISGWFIHDYLLNVLRRKRIWYLNNTGPMDRFQNSVAGGAPSWFIYKAIAFGGLLGIYFANYRF